MGHQVRKKAAPLPSDGCSRKRLNPVLMTALICSCFLAALWLGLYIHEIRTPEGAMDSYLAKVQAGKWEELYQSDTSRFSEYSTEESYIEGMKQLYAGADLSHIGYALSSRNEDDSIRFYNVVSNQQICTVLEVHRVDSFRPWAVRTSYGGRNWKINLLEDGIHISVNGNPVTSQFAKKSDVNVNTLSGIELDHSIPVAVQYEVDNVIGIPGIAADQPDQYQVIIDQSALAIFIGRKPDQENSSAYQDALKNAGTSYARYIFQDIDFFDLANILDTSSPFFDTVMLYDNQWVYAHDKYQVENVSVSDILPIGDEYFTGKISFDYRITADQEYVYPSSYQLFFRRDPAGRWRLLNLIQLNS